MEKLSEIVGEERLPLDIEIRSYLSDHRFLDKAVLPAAEAMRILADSVAPRFAGVDVTRIRDASFAKFLFVKPDQRRIEAFNRVGILKDGGIRSSLVTKFRSGTSSITRAVEHVRVRFDSKESFSEGKVFKRDSICGDDFFEVDPKLVYDELVPFGPSFRNVISTVRLTRNGAAAEVSGGKPELAEDSSLGSVFALDAAFHAACVWGQRYFHYTAFPVGIRRRRVFKKTRAGESYLAEARPVRADSKALLFDIWIYGRDGRACESNAGVLMKDVSAGRMKPPPWILKGIGEK